MGLINRPFIYDQTNLFIANILLQNSLAQIIKLFSVEQVYIPSNLSKYIGHHLPLVSQFKLYLQKMKPQNDSLIYIQLTSITNISNQKLSNVTLNLHLRRQKQPQNPRIPIASKQFIIAKQKTDLNQVALALYQKQDYLEIEFKDEGNKIDGYLRFPLEKLVEMPRVRHEVECQLIEKNWDRFFEGPLRNIVQVDLALTCLNRVIGKLVISKIEIDLTRDTETVGKMDPYVELTLQGETKKTTVRDNEGKHCIWTDTFEFQLNDLSKGLTLLARVLDQDNLSSDLVGSKQISLVWQNMLIPSKKEASEKTFTLLHDSQSAGIIKLSYKFIEMPFNF